MPTTYDPALPTAKDWVRFLTGDTAAPFVLQDEEIAALLVEFGQNKYSAACWAGRRLARATGNVVERHVAELHIKYADGGAGSAYQSYLDTLCAKGQKPALFKNI